MGCHVHPHLVVRIRVHPRRVPVLPCVGGLRRGHTPVVHLCKECVWNSVWTSHGDGPVKCAVLCFLVWCDQVLVLPGAISLALITSMLHGREVTLTTSLQPLWGAIAYVYMALVNIVLPILASHWNFRTPVSQGCAVFSHLSFLVHGARTQGRCTRPALTICTWTLAMCLLPDCVHTVTVMFCVRFPSL
jgi:hypothetical protein